MLVTLVSTEPLKTALLIDMLLGVIIIIIIINAFL